MKSKEMFMEMRENQARRTVIKYVEKPKTNFIQKLTNKWKTKMK